MSAVTVEGGKKHRAVPIEWNGDVNLLARIKGERCPDGEWQKVKLLVRVGADKGSEVEVPLPVVEDWMREALEGQFEKEAA